MIHLLKYTFILLLVSLFFGTHFAFADSVAFLLSSQGKIESQEPQSTEWASVSKGAQFKIDQKLRTLSESRAAVKFASGYVVRMKPETTLVFEEKGKRKDSSQELGVLDGVIYLFSRQKSDFPKVKTPHVSASIRGTEFVVEVTKERTVVSVLDGAVALNNSSGSLEISKGEQAVAYLGKAPTKQIMVNPLKEVQWALYYPAVFSLDDFVEFDATASSSQKNAWSLLRSGNTTQARNAAQGGTWQDALIRSLSHYLEGDASKAHLETKQSKNIASASLHLFDASLALARGAVATAQDSLSKAERMSGSLEAEIRTSIMSSVHAHRALISLVLNNTEQAEIELAKARQFGANTIPVRLIESYLYQSKGDLDAALVSLEKARESHAGNSFVLARLAEMKMGSGDIEHARRLANDSLALAPQSAYSHAVVGFVALSRSQPEVAQSHFEQAAELDGSFALAQLGLGLSKIKQGQLDAGRNALTAAVALEPNVSLYRSYLGKAYYEGDDVAFAEREYAIAMELDKNDPTPFLYRSLLRLADHRPIEALSDIQMSIERNNARSVFRSKLLLDQDEATRSVGLGRIYQRLGFSELSRVEAIQALNRDYTNYSAHYLLAAQYRDSQLASRAQITENILGRLFSPVTYNSNNLNIGGEASLNEYTTLFDRPVQRVNTDLQLDSQDESVETRADYVFANNTVGLTFGHAFEYRDGFRDNDWLRSNQLFTLGQLSLSEDTTLVWDGALTTQDNGDVIVNYDPDLEDEDFSSDFDGALLRLGVRKKINTHLTVLSQALYNYGAFDRSDKNVPGRLSFAAVESGGMPVVDDPFTFDGLVDQMSEIDQHLGRFDLQAIWDSEVVSLIVGGSARVEKVDGEDAGAVVDAGSEDVLDFLVGAPISSQDEVDQNSHRVFAYSAWKLFPWATLDLGIAYESIELSENAFTAPFIDRTYAEQQWSPKAGLVVDLRDDTTMRFSYSQSLDRTGRGGIGSLEPTFVGGFNQIFDALPGSSQELFGVGVDHKQVDLGTYLGVHYRRIENDQRVPFVTGGLTIDRDSLSFVESRDEVRIVSESESDLFGAYWYQIISSQLASVFTYDHEDFEEREPLPEFSTHRAAARLNYFSPTGFFAYGEATYRNQETSSAFSSRQSENFWILDTGIGYEFDNRRGAISLSFENVLDEQFRYSLIADEDPVLPGFGAVLRTTFSF